MTKRTISKTSEEKIERTRKKGHTRIDVTYRAKQQDNEDHPQPYVEPYKILLSNEAM